mgnify:CR=1 FL=1
MKKLLFSIFFVFCSPVLQEQIYETTTTVIEMELTVCEKVEKEYMGVFSTQFVPVISILAPPVAEVLLPRE